MKQSSSTRGGSLRALSLVGPRARLGLRASLLDLQPASNPAVDADRDCPVRRKFASFRLPRQLRSESRLPERRRVHSGERSTGVPFHRCGRRHGGRRTGGRSQQRRRGEHRRSRGWPRRCCRRTRRHVPGVHRIGGVFRRRVQGHRLGLAQISSLDELRARDALGNRLRPRRDGHAPRATRPRRTASGLLVRLGMLVSINQPIELVRPRAVRRLEGYRRPADSREGPGGVTAHNASGRQEVAVSAPLHLDVGNYWVAFDPGRPTSRPSRRARNRHGHRPGARHRQPVAESIPGFVNPPILTQDNSLMVYAVVALESFRIRPDNNRVTPKRQPCPPPSSLFNANGNIATTADRKNGKCIAVTPMQQVPSAQFPQRSPTRETPRAKQRGVLPQRAAIRPPCPCPRTLSGSNPVAPA